MNPTIPVMPRPRDAWRLGELFWRHTEARRRGSLLWDLAADRKAEGLAYCLRTALAAAFWFDADRRPAALSWIAPLSLGPAEMQATGMIHFHFCRDPGRLAVDMAAAWLAIAPVARVLGIIPRPFRHARFFALAVGARQLALLPNACYLADRDRTTDGCLFVADTGQKNGNKRESFVGRTF